MAKKVKKNIPKWAKIGAILLGGFVILMLVLSKLTREVVFKGCGKKLPDYKYSLEIPMFWKIKLTTLTDTNVFYEIKGSKSLFTISCTNQGVGGDVCEDKYRTKFKVDGKDYEPCFGVINGKWKMGVLNLDTDLKTNATISFWSDGLEKKSIDKILSSVKILTK